MKKQMCKKYPQDEVLPNEEGKCSLCGGDCTDSEERTVYPTIGGTLKVVLNQAGQTDPDTLQQIYALIPNPAMRNAKTVRTLFRHALKALKTWKSQIYECDFAGALIIFAQSKELLENYQPTKRM